MKNELKKDSVGVVLAFFNGRKFLDEQLKSIANQTFPLQELVIVEDACEESCHDLVEPYRGFFQKVQILRNERNLGYNESFSIGIKACSCDLVAISDQDDVWALDKVEHLVKDLQDADLIFGQSRLINSEGKELGKNLEYKHGIDPSIDTKQLNKNIRYNWRHFLSRNFVSGHACLIRRDFWLAAMPYPQELRDFMLYDQWIALMATFLGKGIIYCPEAITYHRIHEKNSVNGKEKQRKDPYIPHEERWVRSLSYLKSNYSHKTDDKKFRALNKFIFGETIFIRLGTFFYLIKYPIYFQELIGKKRKTSLYWKWFKYCINSISKKHPRTS